MKIGVLMNAFREEGKIKSCIRQFDGFPIDNIVITCSETSWKGDLKIDNTGIMALKEGVVVKQNTWENEHEQKNDGMSLLADVDWVLIFAPDMYMTRESMHTLFEFIENTDHKDNKAYGCAMKTYWRDLDTIVKPDWDFSSVAVRVDQRFEYSARLENHTGFDIIPGALMHHLSWVKTDEEMKTKIESYSHADEIDEHWFRDVWLGWHDDLTNFHPSTPSDYERIVKYPLPEGIKNLLDPAWVRKASK